MEEARVSIVLVMKVIIIFSLVASLGKCAFRIQNPHLFTDFSIEMELQWYRIKRMFGRGKLWRIWRITSNSPNFTPQILMPHSQTFT